VNSGAITAGTIDLLPAGLQDPHYELRVSTFDLLAFDRQIGSRQFFEAQRKVLITHYD
jgi:hypothetical protein